MFLRSILLGTDVSAHVLRGVPCSREARKVNSHVHTYCITSTFLSLVRSGVHPEPIIAV